VTAWAVVLAGGVGSRFWPLSTPARPKQLLPLVDDRPLLSNTLDRLAPLVPADRTLVLTNAALRDAVLRHAGGVPEGNTITEPKPAGTAAALTWAAHEIERRDGPSAVMICVHADWSIGDDDEFRRTLMRGVTLAEDTRSLVTVGIVPTRPDPGFGYIQPGAKVKDSASRVERFTEKPNRATAERMVADGYLWNSGIFVWVVGDFLAEVRAVTPEVAPALDSAGADMDKFFATARSIPVDVGVLERSSRVLVIAGDFGWDDVGTWDALARVRRRDASGNAASGAVHLVESANNVVHTEGGEVVLYGVSDLVVVARPGLTLVTTRERAADLKQLVEALPREVRDQA
jgi:mannose-1-phosphate guanylyltransferase